MRCWIIEQPPDFGPSRRGGPNAQNVDEGPNI